MDRVGNGQRFGKISAEERIAADGLQRGRKLGLDRRPDQRPLADGFQRIAEIGNGDLRITENISFQLFQRGKIDVAAKRFAIIESGSAQLCHAAEIGNGFQRGAFLKCVRSNFRDWAFGRNRFQRGAAVERRGRNLGDRSREIDAGQRGAAAENAGGVVCKRYALGQIDGFQLRCPGKGSISERLQGRRQNNFFDRGVGHRVVLNDGFNAFRKGELFDVGILQGESEILDGTGNRQLGHFFEIFKAITGYGLQRVWKGEFRHIIAAAGGVEEGTEVDFHDGVIPVAISQGFRHSDAGCVGIRIDAGDFGVSAVGEIAGVRHAIQRNFNVFRHIAFRFGVFSGEKAACRQQDQAEGERAPDGLKSSHLLAPFSLA